VATYSPTHPNSRRFTMEAFVEAVRMKL